MGICSSKLSENSDSIKSRHSNQQIDFLFIDGRRFHNVEDIVYPLPNDDDETDRLHFRHFLTRYIWQSNFSAPINHLLDDPETKILDVGCGAGSWSFDMATTYPSVNIIGIDISEQPPAQIKPNNFNFVKANVLEGIPFENNTFDYVFQRNLMGAFSEQNWIDVINELVRILKPGGFIELMEHSMLYNMGPATKRLCDAQMGGMHLRGTDPFISQKLVKFLQNQGQLENIEQEIRECHHGANSTKAELNLSKSAINNLVTLYAAWKPRLAKMMQISSEEYDELAKISEKELFEFDTYFKLVRVYARKVVDK
ncbi:S-adenosyl-L-methionine-dependent methyltransferase [Gigaspora rosea]|uniref:S-adenosyl-L-methionine-dependent methyltransferase n=1 Tax=Gigaspora rosea TaxID=44941 RepID=A0A397VQQ1_9GLOM|nr:S-adenosyl-L-methionine-dependent methyltransferase [Gigaspora rosea]